MTDGNRISVNAKGFTLIEVIVALVLGAIASVLLIQFMGGNMERSLAPMVRVDRSYELTAIAESMTAHYKNLLLTDAAPLSQLRTDIENGNVSTNTPYFGEYARTLQYIELDTGSETSCSTDCHILRVDLQRGEHSLTTLFTN